MIREQDPTTREDFKSAAAETLTKIAAKEVGNQELEQFFLAFYLNGLYDGMTQLDLERERVEKNGLFATTNLDNIECMAILRVLRRVMGDQELLIEVEKFKSKKKEL